LLVMTMVENESEESPDYATRTKAEYVARAPRFPIQAPLTFRAGGEKSWHEGKTINISRSGVLFKADHALEPKTMLEMRIAFPPEMTGDVETNVVCWGPIVRRQVPGPGEEFHTLAASIFRHRFKRD
jgi:hypothetical protein